MYCLFSGKKNWVKKSIVYGSTNLTMLSGVTHHCWVKVITGAAVLNCHKGSQLSTAGWGVGGPTHWEET